VKPGEMIPLDGKIISGETTVDEAAITGEPIPKDKRPGAILFAGTLNKMVLLKWKLLPSIDTTFAKIIRLTLKQRHLEVTHRNSFSVSLNSIS
jgi:Cd2+/Zn2+-exporting ATPase